MIETYYCKNIDYDVHQFHIELVKSFLDPEDVVIEFCPFCGTKKVELNEEEN